MTTQAAKSPFATSHDAQRFANKHELMPHQEIADRWYEMSGQRLSRGMIYVICRNAEEKIREALEDMRCDVE